VQLARHIGAEVTAVCRTKDFDLVRSLGADHGRRLHAVGLHEERRDLRCQAAGIAMAFKLIDAAQERWRAVNAPHLVELVRAGARFECMIQSVRLPRSTSRSS
jgi:NADPH:quinone reductase-like Zn-dependent oxidoreductase